ncbi:hypothetical protein EZS27_020302 [termite gut metagenome]|uniref:Thoeris protein ThsB TIR-like domain-containing protein n=1 Tax=termite gut metagenome TaxID=433724 RepID=A0A5J4RBH1_9ZZZZ
MKYFICNRVTDKVESDKIISDILKISENSVAILRETEHSDNWKTQVEEKIQESDFIVFLLGVDTFMSDQIKWEYAKSKELDKQIVGIKSSGISDKTIVSCQGFRVFDDANQCLKYTTRVFDNDRKLKIELYKIMVGSTEKVTEQRLRVNNLFFTITSSIFSVSFIVGKAFEFSLIGSLAIFALTIVAFSVSFFWEKLINSYGKLNTGKFIIIDKIEKQLRTNMFEDEWNVLTRNLNYESNTKTEITIIKRFRFIMVIFAIAEIVFILTKC